MRPRDEALAEGASASGRELSPGPEDPVRIRLFGIAKRFGSTVALAGADLELRAGEVHALLGENGAGKTTLVRILYGMIAPDAGRIEVAGKRTEFRRPSDALRHGIGLVHQHFMLVPALSVAENLTLGDRGIGWLSKTELRRAAREKLEAFELDLDPDLPASELGVAQQQQLEIVRALARGVDVLILDEPTAVLAASEVRALLRLLRALRDRGRTVVFISHKLHEVTEVADRVSVLRSGRTVGTVDVGDLDPARLARWMVGRDLERLEPPAPAVSPAVPALRLIDLYAPGLRGLDLEVGCGQVVALAGIDGNGQTPLEEVFAGVRLPTAGKIEVLRPPLALVSGDRHRTGLVLDLSVEENLILQAASKRRVDPQLFRAGWFAGGVIDRAEMRRRAERALSPFELRGAPEAPARSLSGGNQQKVCVARALSGEPGVIVVVNPTRGLDVEAARAVRATLLERARAGAAVLVISTDLDEVLELGTRIGVLFRGRLRELPAGERSREAIGACMLGRGF